MSTIPSIDPAVPPLGKRGAFEGVARRHGRRRNPARMTPRSSLRTPTNPALHSPQRWVEKADRSIKGSDTRSGLIGEQVEVLSVSRGDNRSELIATCQSGGRRYEVALLDIDIDADATTSRLIAAYRRWTGN